MQSKLIALSLIVAITAMLIGTTVTSDAFAVKKVTKEKTEKTTIEKDGKVKEKVKEKKAKSCNNVKVRVNVNGVEENQTLVATVTIGNSSKTKMGVVDINETSITIPINFVKVLACPPIGSDIFGDVNGTGFTDQLTSTKKPNKISVDLS